MKKIVLTGGGSAGHVTPNIALLPSLQAAGYEGAVDMVRQMAEDCYRKNKNADLKKYLAEQTEAGE